MDYHHHAILPGYRARLDAWGIGAQPGVPFPAWTPEGSLAWMDDAAVDRALLSVGSPGFYFGDQSVTTALTEICNAELAELRDRWPERFGIFATVPLPELATALAQVERALEVDGFDGVGLLTQYGGRYLGDRAWDELYVLLNERGALAHVHPTVPEGWDPQAPVRPSVLDYPFETTRAILELARQRVFSRYPAIRWVFSHGGGTFGALADRMSGSDPAAPIAGGDSMRDLLFASRFDSALVGSAGLAALAVVAGTERIVFGSDLPFVSAGRIARDRAALQNLSE
ncbi:amidohydrolase [Jatrophihabitans cynanchi]|uniref:6-methylsalicylate decarboxylase n=1 Tax=Jatrophihabitans cynanchi TaxID=2944128 RepID=A0ABY7K281_9ACTN|nr:amidohydrolase family protein [Jatrophihabitans sp. SB3-54]WAX58960.1 amidohydrolase [Jatrophihabitans sp. SB3-54]